MVNLALSFGKDVNMKHSRSIQAIGKRVRKLVGGLYPLARFEQKYVKQGKRASLPPIFIVGAARSGTTLLYQLMTYYFRCSYLSNFASVFYKYPVIITRMTRPFAKGYDDHTFQSDYGFTKGLWAPSEAGGVFTYWFGDRDTVDHVFIKDCVYALSSTTGGPFVCKNVVNSIRLREICNVFPDALIIHVKRDSIYNAQSIVLGLRNKRLQMDASTFAKETISGDDINFAVKYLYHIESRIEDAFKQNHCNHFIQIDYGKLCDNCSYELNQIKTLYENQGYALKYKNFRSVAIDKSERIVLNDNEWTMLLDHYRIKDC